MRLKRFSPEEESQICQEYLNERMGCYKLAKKWKTNHMLIRNILIRNGHKLRSLSEAARIRESKKVEN